MKKTNFGGKKNPKKMKNSSGVCTSPCSCECFDTGQCGEVLGTHSNCNSVVNSLTQNWVNNITC